MANDRNAGAKPKYKVPTSRLQRIVPTSKIPQIDKAINEICKELKNKI